MSIAGRISARNRQRKWRLFLKEMAPDKTAKTLDVGFNAREYSPIDNYIEKHYPYPERLTALGLPSKHVDAFRRRYPKVTTVLYDGGRFPFEDGVFDVCWSNAVLEHVGDASRQTLFLKEIGRVAKRAFVTTPNRLFPVEVHTRTPFLHWLPERTFDAFLEATRRGWAAGGYMNLLSRHELEMLLSRAGVERYAIHRNKLAGLTLDFAVVSEGTGASADVEAEAAEAPPFEDAATA